MIFAGPEAAAAPPQIGVGFTVGAAGIGKHHEVWDETVFHLGARTDTTEFDYRVHEKLNLEYSKHIWQYCVGKNIPLYNPLHRRIQLQPAML